jgi:hypothetical protein
MPRYFFNVVYDANIVADRDGSELSDLAAAQAQARSILREFVIEALRHSQPVDRYWVEIRDGSGTELGTVMFADISGIEK